MVDRLQARLVSPAGAALLVLVALASYAVQALAWPLERGRDSWDYWLTFLQLADRDPPFSALQVFRTPVAPLVTGIPMWLGGARLTEVAFAFLYALDPRLGLGGRLISRHAALATALVLLVTPTYAGLFHEVSSDPVFAFHRRLVGGGGGRAWKTGATWWLVGVGVGVALMTLCRPASQVALLACVLVPLVARRGARRIAAGVVVSARRRRHPARGLGGAQRSPLRRLHRRAGQQGLGSRSSGSAAPSRPRTATRRGGSRAPSSGRCCRCRPTRVAASTSGRTSTASGTSR